MFKEAFHSDTIELNAFNKSSIRSRVGKVTKITTLRISPQGSLETPMDSSNPANIIDLRENSFFLCYLTKLWLVGNRPIDPESSRRVGICQHLVEKFKTFPLSYFGPPLPDL